MFEESCECSCLKSWHQYKGIGEANTFCLTPGCSCRKYTADAVTKAAALKAMAERYPRARAHRIDQ